MHVVLREFLVGGNLHRVVLHCRINRGNNRNSILSLNNRKDIQREAEYPELVPKGLGANNANIFFNFNFIAMNRSYEVQTQQPQHNATSPDEFAKDTSYPPPIEATADDDVLQNLNPTPTPSLHAQHPTPPSNILTHNPSSTPFPPSHFQQYRQ